jgi:hypothetical protein
MQSQLMTFSADTMVKCVETERKKKNERDEQYVVRGSATIIQNRDVLRQIYIICGCLI